MKNFIKERLRLVLENVISEAEFSTHVDVDNVKNIINQLQKTYGTDRIHTVESEQTLYDISKLYNVSIDKLIKRNNLSSNELTIGQKLVIGADEYFLDMSPTGGQGTVDIYVDKHGRAKTQRSDRAANINRRATDFSKEDPKSLRFMGIPVGRGIEHPDTYSNKTRQALTIGGYTVEQDGSPASDAAIKAYLAYPEEIISLVNRNRKDYNAYVDDKEGAAQQVATKGNQYTQMRKSDKLAQNIEKEKNKPEITQNDDYEAELQRKNKDLSPQIKSAMEKGERKVMSQLRREFKINLKEIEFIQRLRNLLNSDPNHPTKIPQEIEAAGKSYLYKYISWLSQFKP